MKTVAALIFVGMAPLDLFGPVQVFSASCTPREDDPARPDTSKPVYRTVFVAKEKRQVDRTERRRAVVAPGLWWPIRAS